VCRRKKPDLGSGPHRSDLAVAPETARTPDPRLQTLRNDYPICRLQYPERQVIGSCLPRHRGKEFAKFLNQLESQRTGTNAYDGRVKTPELGIAAADDRHSVMHVYARHHVRLFANYREPGMPPRPEPQHSVRELHGEAS